MRRFRSSLVSITLALCLLLGVPGLTLAREAAPATEDPVLEARVMQIAGELRCLVCQNETIAASHADLAVDLRNQVREMLKQGQSDDQIYAYMTARYGDFVLYRPPFKSLTAVLWLAPALLLVAGLGGLWLLLRRRNRLSDEHFDAEEAAPTEATLEKAEATR